MSLTDHQHNSYYGFNIHDARQQSLYVNAIFQSIINTTNHKFKTGVSFMLDNMDESFAQTLVTGTVKNFDFGRLPFGGGYQNRKSDSE